MCFLISFGVGPLDPQLPLTFFSNSITYLEIKDVDSKQFFIRGNARTTKGHNKKQGKKLIRENVKKYLFSIRMVGEWSKLSDKTVNIGSM